MIIMYIHKSITISEHQARWITEHHINLSRLVQASLKEKMKEVEVRLHE